MRATIVAAWAGIVFLAMIARAASPAGGPDDLILVNGKIWTVDPAKSEAQALAVWRDRILMVGTDDEIRALAGPATKTIDLRGRRVVPGFYDSHIHLVMSGIRLSQVALKDAADEAEFGRRLV